VATSVLTNPIIFCLITIVDTILFVPGFRSTDVSAYEETFAIFRAKGYEVRFVPINWRATSIKHWAAEVSEAYADYEPGHTLLAGFSLGAYSALVAAADRPPARLLLLSLSPYFAEDIPYLGEKSITYMRPRRMKAFSQTRFEEIAPRITSNTTLFVGSEETPELQNRARQAHRQIRRSRLVTVTGVRHDMGHPAYQSALSDEL